ncbi:MAG TPA: DUF559 domain-containing protein [Corynebacterium nuruki]|uniref:DUF559 domain-containing protein n=1 Tax=Corynebacterium nuruki TaxID=1032851 RepID=A0A3D4T2K3_9CORY|nr:DUF559 domain-containing protein [Corynebacterium nuruki]
MPTGLVERAVRPTGRRPPSRRGGSTGRRAEPAAGNPAPTRSVSPGMAPILPPHPDDHRCPGPGPDHTRGILPARLPRKRRDLLESGTATRWDLDHRYLTVARGRVLEIPEGAEHPDPADFGGFPGPAVHRARAHAQNHPDGVLAGFAAAPFHGLGPDWSDSAPTLLLADRRKEGAVTSTTAARHPLRPVFRRPPKDLRTVHPDPFLPELTTVDAATCIIQCVDTVLSRRHVWNVLTPTEIPDTDARAVQLLDAFFQCTPVTGADLRTAAHRRIPTATMNRLLALADHGAESPMETSLRLLVHDLLPVGYRWQSQVDLTDVTGGSGDPSRPRAGVTVADLACRPLRIALYYDGGHHDGVRHRGRDQQIDRDLRRTGWQVIRFNRFGVFNIPVVHEEVLDAVARALRTT